LLIAGPWLYTFNAWAASFTAALGAKAIISPLENNRQNLEKTVPEKFRQQVFVTLFAWPPLFRIKTPDGFYRFNHFYGSRNEWFSLLRGAGSSVVIPGAPFCITDKRAFLSQAGFGHFILDFSGGLFDGSFPLKKQFYKEVMKAASDGKLPGGNSAGISAQISRFNWKNGFFSEKTQIN